MPTPREFRYWEQLERPAARWARRVGRVLLGYDPAPAPEIVETVGQMYYDADPLAEAFVDEVYLKRGAREGRAMLDAALAAGVASVPDAPESLKALFADLEEDPAWVDPPLVELGARVFRRWGTHVFRFAGAVTLEAYTENSVAKPLVLSGGYVGNSTRHRFLETASFWVDVSEPGNLAPGAVGRATALRVRIMHVFVRRRLMKHPEWDLQGWGVPISQADALLTLMGGSVAPAVALRAMGYRTSEREIEGLLMFWRYVGHLMGVRPRWYPASVKEGVQLGFMAAVKSVHGAGDDGRKLCVSFAEAFDPAHREEPAQTWADRLLDEVEHRVHRGYTQFFLPPWTHKRQGLPQAGLWTLVPAAWFPFNFAAETLRRHIPALEGVADRSGRRRRERWMARHMKHRRAEFKPPEAFSR